ncbi:TonB-dependent siderophore receptor [Opitutus terrae]|uniref:TonB-dependent receptor plug n=1 Tax=Opitutus terrae (strain DSM 11246 / JCM 15787 / PB90-1) TaxID=452637 RepID=B1ZRF0_OPITP|nr:TonB-dependent receptor plug domain-containing protein [Opitutus terrae]ACB74637.1 TonB-dependent receptor plug [Opitutus terrae PB90-1]
MNRTNHRIALACAGLAALLPCLVRAQANPPTAAPAVADEVVELPQFVISEKRANPYLSGQALSTSRVAMLVQDIPQTVSVVTAEFMKDSMSFRMLDAAKYVTPVVESTLPWGGDRYTIRGFQVSQEFIDGSVISGGSGYSMSIPQFNLDRIEVIKGPNAILVPGGSPGGVMNPITKEPMSKDAASVTLNLAQYNGNDFGVDVNRVLNEQNKMAFRLVFGIWRNDQLYIKNHFRNGYEISPSFSVELSPVMKLVVKADFLQNRETNLAGLPIDPSVGSNQTAVIARGLPRDWSFGNSDDNRHRSTERLSAELRTTMGSHVTSRLYVMADHVRRIDPGGTGSALSTGTAAGRTGGGSRNPTTGMYEPGVNWSTVANGDGTVSAVSTAVPITDPSTWIYTRNNGKVDLEYEEAHLKNDYAAQFDGAWFKSTTLGGLAADFSKVRFLSWGAAPRGDVANNNLNAITYPPYVFPQIRPADFSLPNPTSVQSGGDLTSRQYTLQAFLFETFKAWNDRIQVSAGVSRFYGNLSRTDNTLTALNATILNTAPTYAITTNAKTLGLVIKPIKQISLFASRNTTGGAMPGELSAGTYLEKTTTFGPDAYHATPVTVQQFRPTSGSQDEFGVKTSALAGRLTASFAHFKISQQNYGVPNSEYYTLVAQGRQAEANLLQNPIYLDLASKGWEFEATYSPVKNLTILGNYTSFKERQPITDVRVRGVPDKAGALYLDYQFTSGPLTGFGINVGVEYKGDVAGENVNAYTTTMPIRGIGLVPQQPSFLVAGRTLVNIGFSYKRPNWSVRFMVANAFDKDYILAAGSRTSAVVGDPRNIKGSFTYTF